MDLKTTISIMAAILVIIGILAVVLAVNFGRQYNAGGTKKQKYLCVGCVVASCVCIMTAVQILMMFRNVLFS